MSVLDPAREKIKEIIPTLPSNWADMVASKMGIRREQVWALANGSRGKRNRKVIELLKHLKALQHEFMEEIANEL